MADAISFNYSFILDQGETIRFQVELDQKTLKIRSRPPRQAPGWAALDFHRCGNCPLDPGAQANCPVALNLVGIVERFGPLVSHEQARVVVETAERTYMKETAVHQGLSSLLGIVMTTSGCPILDYLKPMVRFHLPFASIEETLYRMTSMYLLAQYLRRQAGQPAKDDLDELAGIYAEVGKVNREFSQRLVSAAEEDANVNALVELDVFASMVQLVAEDSMSALTPYFSAYLDGETGPAKK